MDNEMNENCAWCGKWYSTLTRTLTTDPEREPEDAYEWLCAKCIAEAKEER